MGLMVLVSLLSLGCKRKAAAPSSVAVDSAGGEALAPRDDRGEEPPERAASEPTGDSSRDASLPGPQPPARSDRPLPAHVNPSSALRRASQLPSAAGAELPPPPEHAPDNPFGYLEPVRGCFEGRVYFLESKPVRLPRRYDRLEQHATLHACEWNVWPGLWEQGLPGFDERHELFAIRYTGGFRVTEAGSYEFRVRSDDGSRLTIDGEVVVDNDGAHAPRSRSGTVELDAGDHSLVLEYFQGHHHVNLQVWVTPPGGPEGLVSVRGR